MSGSLSTRLALAMIGAAGGLSLYLMVEGARLGWIGERGALVLASFLLPFFGALLAMAGRMPPLAAALRAGGLALLVAALVAMVARRWPTAEGVFLTPLPGLAALTLACLPVPMLIAHATTGSWRDYPALFRDSWGILVRGFVALVFTGIVWLVIWLSDSILQVVGIDVISRLVDLEVVPFLVTGIAFGLAVAVVAELAGHISPRLVLWLLRLLLPVVTAVSAIFAVTALLWGFDRTFEFLSPALSLLAMAAAGITLVTVTLDEDDSAAAQGMVLRRSAQVMALLVPVMAVLAGRALWLRVAAQGWTPDRVLLALMVLVALAHGLAYAVAVLRGAGWAGRIRAANPPLALGVICLAALSLTPVLDAERISARDQAARFIDGRKAPSQLSAADFADLGHAGTEALARLRDAAEASPDGALLAALDGQPATGAGDAAYQQTLVAEVGALLPVQPETATGMRQSLLLLMQTWDLEDIRNGCEMRDAAGHPGCVLVVADLLTAVPGEEAVLALDRGGWVSVEGLYLNGGGTVMRRQIEGADGTMLTDEEARALIRQWQEAPPPVAPAPVNQLGTGAGGLFFVP